MTLTTTLRSLAALAALTLTSLTLSAAPERPFINSISMTIAGDASHRPVVMLSWSAPSLPPASYEIQRKLFLWGWRSKAHLVGANAAWADTKPAKRVMTYRMRAVDASGASKWSNVVRIEP